MTEIIGEMAFRFVSTLASGFMVLAGLVGGFVWVMFRMS